MAIRIKRKEKAEELAARIVERHDRVTADMRRQYPSMKMPEPADSVFVARALLSTSASERGMREALEGFVAKIDPAILVERDLPMSPLADELRAALAALSKAEGK